MNIYPKIKYNNLFNIIFALPFVLYVYLVELVVDHENLLLFGLLYGFELVILALALSGFAFSIAAAPSNDTLEIDKTEYLEGEVEISEDLVVDKEKENTNSNSNTPYEDSSKTPEIDANSAEEGNESRDNVGIDDETSGSASEDREETLESLRPSAP